MKISNRIFIASTFALCFLNFPIYANTNLSPEQSKELVKKAIVYAVEDMDPNQDYSKYVAKDFINHVDANTFNYPQWVTHLKNIKAMMKSMTVVLQHEVAESNKVAVVYEIKSVKKDGSKLTVKDLAYFEIKNGKITYCDELTRLTQGNPADKDIGSHK